MVNVAMIGVGAISGIYLENLTQRFKGVRLIGVCDLIRERAEKAIEKYPQIPKLYETMHDAFADPEVDVVLNLTRPYEHYEVSRAALLAGKHVYHEKPLAADWEEGVALVKLAQEKGLLLGGAPDTYLGAGIQTCRKLIDDGMIGDVIGAAAFMICHGHETWHPDPDFYYKRGGGPMMDMGPYYLTAMLNLMGEVKGVTGVTKKSFTQRTITSQPHYGEIVDVEIDTYVTGTLHFASGAIGTLFTTFDVHYAPQNQARFEVYGTKGTLLVPDPNTFGGPVRLFRPEDQLPFKAVDPGSLGPTGAMIGYKEIPLLFDYKENCRGLGLADMCRALETGRAFRSAYQQTAHVLEILTAFEKSSRQGAYWPLETRYERAEPMQNNPMHGLLD
ncbi:MAG: Gfo/Idh/MocA family oxidoreductase [Oscillospiraceae bacterium]|jgi:predicted dehydrogenase|nr:Gfo/Idh/MocA family oxidoreductase [Oscillospiraceae bacterium]